MKKLKLILQSKYFLLTLIFFTTLYVVLAIHVPFYKTSYNENTTCISGTINKIKIDGNKLTLQLKANEKIVVNYYLKNKQEKQT